MSETHSPNPLCSPLQEGGPRPELPSIFVVLEIKLVFPGVLIPDGNVRADRQVLVTVLEHVGERLPLLVFVVCDQRPTVDGRAAVLVDAVKERGEVRDLGFTV